MGFCTCAKSDKHGEVPESTVSCSLLSQFLQFHVRTEASSEAESEARVLEVFRLGSLAAMSWGAGDQQQQDLWSALVTVAEADMEDIEYLMVRLQDSDLDKIRQAAQAALVASSRLQAVEQEAAENAEAATGPPQVATVAASSAKADPGAKATSSSSPTPAPPPGATTGAVSKKAGKAVPPGPTFAKDTAPSTVAAAKAMTAAPVPVKPLPKGPSSPSPPPAPTTPAKKKTVVKCPPKVPDPPTVPEAPTSAEDAIALMMAPASSSSSLSGPPPTMEPKVKAMPDQVADTVPKQVAQPTAAAADPVADAVPKQSAQTAAASSSAGPQQPGDTGAAPTVDPDEPGPPGPRDPPQFAPPLRYSQWLQYDERGRWFEDSPPGYHDLSTECKVRCPSCWVRSCGRRNRPGYRRAHEKHLCPGCHTLHKELNPDEPTAT